MGQIMKNAIVVGVDDSKAAVRALRWAVDEAQLHDFSLLIVNVPAVHDDRASWDLLKRSAQIASFRQPTVPVSTMAGAGAPSDVLAELSAQSVLVVLGARGGDQTEHAIGSVARRTAAHARCPVVIVPEDLNAAAETAANHVIAVGVSPLPAGRHAFEAALLEAQRRRAVVNAVAGWPHVGPLPEELAAIAARYPEVTVNLIVREEEPAEALTFGAAKADLLVVGCHHTTDPWGSRLGAVPSAILGRVSTPTMVVSASADMSELNTQLAHTTAH